jgi:hypothetical protein
MLRLIGKPPKDKSTILYTIEFGNFNSNSKEVSPPIPPEYWIPLCGVIISTIVEWSIPIIIEWTKTRTTARKLNYYHKQINFIYDDGNLDENDVKSFDKLKKKKTDAYSKGKINEMYYKLLRDKIANLINSKE